MKIVTRGELLCMPEETIFCSFNPETYEFGHISIKGEIATRRRFAGVINGEEYWEDDFYVQPLYGLDAVDSEHSIQSMDILDDAMKGSAFSFDLYTPGVGDDGNEYSLYAIWENEDILGLISRLQQCIK
jgi:hypothetical protein